MPWKDNTAHVRYRRRYQCECGFIFDMRHESLDEPMPDCPRCVEMGQAAAAGVDWVPPLPAIGTTKGKAIDLAQKIAEEDFGMTNMRDNQRPGDSAFLPDAPIQTAEAEKQLREIMEASAALATQLPQPIGQPAPDGTRSWITDPASQRDNFFQGNLGGAAEGTIGQAEAAKAASAAAAADGVDPVGLLERGRLSGNMPMRLNVISAVPSSDLPEPLQKAQAARGT